MYAQKKPIENTHIVRERDRQRFRELSSVVLLGVLIGGFLIVFTWQNISVIRLGHEATRLQKQKKDIENANKFLQIERDRLTALAAVERRVAALGFEKTDPRAVVMVSREPSADRHSPSPSVTVSGERRTANDRGSR
jgi:hypothetical protein